MVVIEECILWKILENCHYCMSMLRVHVVIPLATLIIELVSNPNPCSLRCRF